MTGNSKSVRNGLEENLTAAVGVIVLEADRVDFRTFCCGGGGSDCGPAVAQSHAAVADVATLPGGRREQDPAAVLAAVRQCLNETVAAGGWVTGVRARLVAARVVAVAVANRHGGSLVAWNSCTGAPLSNVILWSDDAATCSRADGGRRGRGQQSVASDAGASAIRRLCDSDAAVRAAHRNGQCNFGTIDAWIVWNLTGGVNGGVFATDPSVTAVFTSLTKNSPPEWKAESLASLGVSPESLPSIKAAYGLYGYFRDGPLRETPICGVVANRQPSSANGQSRLDSETATNVVTVAETGSLPRDDDRRNALMRLTASVRETIESASAASGEIEGTQCGLTSKVPPAYPVPKLNELCEALRAQLPEPVRTEKRDVKNDDENVLIKDDDEVVIKNDGKEVVIKDDGEEFVKTPANILPVADVPEAPKDDPLANTSADGHDGDMLMAADDGIESEKPTNRKWTVGATVVAVGVGALLMFGGYKWLTHK